METSSNTLVSVIAVVYAINARIWDVELGTAIYVDVPGQDVVIDLGCSARFDSPLDYINDRYGVNQIDYLIQSHLHHDHIEDVQSMDVFDARPRLMVTNEDGEKALLERLEEADPDEDEQLIEDAEYYFTMRERYSTPAEEDPSDPSWADRVTFSNMALETEDVSGSLYRRLNNLSLVTIIERDGFKLVTAGDMMDDGLETFMEEERFVDQVSDAQLLVAPHHGRKSGYYKEFVEAVNPDAVIFSDKGKSGVEHSDRDRYAEHTTGIQVKNEKTGSVETNRHVLTTRNDGRIHVKANTANSWNVSKRPVSTERSTGEPANPNQVFRL